MRCGLAMASMAGLLLASSASAQPSPADAKREAMLARAKAAEISDAWTPPPGEPLTYA